MYVFPIGFTPDDVNNVVKTTVPFRQEFSRKIVFLKGDVVVHTDENRPDLETMLPQEVFFSDDKDKQSYYVFPKSALFSVERKKLDVGEYYELKCVNCG